MNHRTQHPSPSHRALLALLAALVGSAVGALRLLLGIPANDLVIPHAAAGLLLEGQNPYSVPTDGWPSNPLTTVLALVPLAGMPADLAAAIVVGMGVALLIYGAVRSGEPLRLWALAAWPFWYAVLYAQWAILFLAIWLLPGLAWLTPIKPQLGLSVFLSRFTWRQAAYAVGFVLLTLLVAPSWPLRWLDQIGGYGGFVPVLSLPALGLVAVLGIMRRPWSPRAVLYAAFCCSPQRLWYDQLLLWATPRHGWQVALLSGLSWLNVVTVQVLPLDRVWIAVLSQFVPCGLYLLAERPAADLAQAPTRPAPPRLGSPAVRQQARRAAGRAGE